MTRLSEHSLDGNLQHIVSGFQWSSGSMHDSDVRGLRIKSIAVVYVFHDIIVIWALGTGCTQLLQCLDQLTTPPSMGGGCRAERIFRMSDDEHGWFAAYMWIHRAYHLSSTEGRQHCQYTNA